MLRKRALKGLSGLPNLRLGGVTFTQKFHPAFVVCHFLELSEIETRSKKGASCRRLDATCLWEFDHDSIDPTLRLPKRIFAERKLCKMIQKIVATCDIVHVCCVL